MRLATAGTNRSSQTRKRPPWVKMISCFRFFIALMVFAATRLGGIEPLRFQFLPVSSSMAEAKNSLAVVLGLTNNNSIPSFANYARIESLKPCNANLLAQYSLFSGAAR